MIWNAEFIESRSIPEPMSGCWLWEKSMNSHGYGHAKQYGHSPIGAHRISWRVYRGEIPSGLSVLHKCDQPSCVNPEHLFLGTQKENMADMAAKGRADRTKKPHGSAIGGHRLTEVMVWNIRFSGLYDRWSSTDIANALNVSISTISLIRLRKTWKRVTKSYYRRKPKAGETGK